MGMSFSNIHIKKNENYDIDKIKKMLLKYMEKKGYKQLDDEENADVVTAIFVPEQSEWVTIGSDMFEFKNSTDTKNISEPFSNMFKTDVLTVSCIDSDYLMMNLINVSDNTDAWINVGSLYGMKMPRRTGYNAWKNKVNNFEIFKNIMKSEHIFAEEALYESCELLGMLSEQVVFSSDFVEGRANCKVEKLYFSLPESYEKEPTKLVINLYEGMPCRIGKSTPVFVVNRGGKSKGVAVIFTGDYIENDELTFVDVTFESDYGSEKRKIVPIKLEKVELNDGGYAYYWEDKNFQIPPKVNPELPWSRYDKMEFERQFGVRFTPQGDSRKVLDVKVYIIPLEYYDGKYSACWYVWKFFKSKSEFIEHFNNRWNGTSDVLNPDDYDL